MMQTLATSILLLLFNGSFAFQPLSDINGNLNPILTNLMPVTHTSRLQDTTALSVSTTVEQEESGKQPPNTTSKAQDKPKKSKSLDMPWSEMHAFALRDNLPKYTRILPGKKPKNYALWRTLMQDVPELSGYPIDFLKRKAATNDTQAPDLLPYLDNFYFEPSGGLSGQVYGVRGLKDGTVIETAPVGQVEVTIPLGYVLTEDDGVAYELGKPLVQDQETYSLDGNTKKAIQTAGSFGRQAASTMAGAINTRAASQTVGSEEDPDAMLVRLGASTGVLLAGATAMSMLSHHLTVNVFWV